MSVGEYRAPTKEDSRGPCPALNVLANHGYLNRDGRKLTVAQIRQAVIDVYNVDAIKIIDAVFPLKDHPTQLDGVRSNEHVLEDGTPYLNLNDLALHAGKFEHDVSLSRHDHHTGNNYSPSRELVDEMKKASSDGKYVTASEITAYRASRYLRSQKENPNFKFDYKEAFVSATETALAMNILGRDERISLEHLESFFFREELPKDYVKLETLMSPVWFRIQKTTKPQYLTDVERTDCKQVKAKRSSAPEEDQEIIEFPILDLATKKIISEFHEYVRPKLNPKFDPFCTELTGITQEQVGTAMDFKEALDTACLFVEPNINEGVFVTCGNWDLSKMLPMQAARENVTLPVQFRTWINIKKVFTKLTKKKEFPNMVTILEHFKLPLVGRHHSGIDDSRNIARVALSLYEAGCEFLY